MKTNKFYLISWVSVILIIILIGASISSCGGQRTLTVEELLKQIIDNPNRYKEGTIMQVTGIMMHAWDSHDEGEIYLGPEVQGWHIDAKYKIDTDQGGKLYDFLRKKAELGEKNFSITLRGTFSWVKVSSKSVRLYDCFLIR